MGAAGKRMCAAGKRMCARATAVACVAVLGWLPASAGAAGEPGWGSPVDLAPATAYSAAALVSPGAGRYTAVWTEPTGTNGLSTLEAAQILAAGPVIARQTMPSHSSAWAPTLLADRQGDELLVWDSWDDANVDRIAFATASGGGAFSAPVLLENPGGINIMPTAAMDDAGDAAIVYGYAPGDNTERILAVFRARDGTITGPLQVSPSEPVNRVQAMQAAIAPDGEATIVWDDSTDNSVRESHGTAQSGFSTPVSLSSAGSAVSAPKVVMDDQGRTVATWQERIDNQTGELRAAFKPPFASFGAPTNETVAFTYLDWPVTLGPGGQALGFYGGTDGALHYLTANTATEAFDPTPRSFTPAAQLGAGSDELRASSQPDGSLLLSRQGARGIVAARGTTAGTFGAFRDAVCGPPFHYLRGAALDSAGGAAILADDHHDPNDYSQPQGRFIITFSSPTADPADQCAGGSLAPPPLRITLPAPTITPRWPPPVVLPSVSVTLPPGRVLPLTGLLRLTVTINAPGTLAVAIHAALDAGRRATITLRRHASAAGIVRLSVNLRRRMRRLRRGSDVRFTIRAEFTSATGQQAYALRRTQLLLR
jgi:hypothetical protein